MESGIRNTLTNWDGINVLEQYKNHVKPAFDYYIAPTMIHADLIVPRGGENEVAIKLIVQHVQVKI